MKRNRKYDNYTQAELFKVLQGKNPHINKAVEVFGLELIDEDTGEYLNTHDLLQQAIKPKQLPEMDIDLIFKSKEQKTTVMKNEKTNKTANPFKKKATAAAPVENKQEREVVFPEGITIFTAKENAPDFILGDVVLQPEKFIDWLNENTGHSYTHEKFGVQFRFTLKRGKSGHLYLQVSDYKPKAKNEDEPAF